MVGGVGGLIGAGVVLVAPQCLTPYGMVDPLLVRVWLGKVGEALALFAAPPTIAIGYAGAMVAGVAASAWWLAATRDPRWAALLTRQLAAFALTCLQLRGAYVGAVVAAPGLAATITAARARCAAWLIAAWIAFVGMLYPIATEAFVPKSRTSGQAEAGVVHRSRSALRAAAGEAARAVRCVPTVSRG